MYCSKCGNEIRVLSRIDVDVVKDDYEHVTLCGRCDECGYDVIWDNITYVDGRVFEYDYRQ
jgi:uncharacterized protein with PIN domain